MVSVWQKILCIKQKLTQVTGGPFYVLSSQKFFFGVGHNFFPLFRSKALQKTKNWKILWIFSPGRSPLKFYYITLLCEMELGRKFKFFPIFHYKTILFSSESEFSMKNVIFWGTSCWCSSKIKKLGGGTHKLIKLQLQLMRPPPTFLIFELLSHNALQKNTFFMQNSDSEEKSIIL